MIILLNHYILTIDGEMNIKMCAVIGRKARRIIYSLVNHLPSDEKCMSSFFVISLNEVA